MKFFQSTPGRLALAWRRRKHHASLRQAGLRPEYIEFEGLRFFLYRSPDGGSQLPGEKPPLVLLHGFLDANITFRRLAPRLMERYTIYAPDLPGFGRTALPSARDIWRLPLLAAALARLLFVHLRLESVTLLTHSMGGLVALHILRYLERSGKVAAVRELHAINPGLIRMPSAERDSLRRMIFPETESEVRDLVARFYALRPPELPRFVVRGLLADWTRIGYRYLAENTIEDEEQVFFTAQTLRFLKTPAAIYWGELERVLPRWQLGEIKKSRRFRIVELPGAGHAMQLESPEEFLAEFDRLQAPRTTGARRKQAGRASSPR